MVDNRDIVDTINSKRKPKVTIVITTKNEEKNIEACLDSLRKQTYKNIEIIIVDNFSTDRTKNVALGFTQLYFEKGPERSAQRNFGVSKATGIYVLILDADMILTEKVVEESVQRIEMTNCGGIVIPEESFGEGFWALCKGFERSFYLGNESIEAARFFPKAVFQTIGGFDEAITGPEDWDLSQRVKQQFGISRIDSKILHNEGNLSLRTTIRKKFYYSKKFKEYLMKIENSPHYQKQLNILSRYSIFLSQPYKLLKNPILGSGMLFMKTVEFGAGALGFFISKLNR